MTFILGLTKAAGVWIIWYAVRPVVLISCSFHIFRRAIVSFIYGILLHSTEGDGTTYAHIVQWATLALGIIHLSVLLVACVKFTKLDWRVVELFFVCAFSSIGSLLLEVYIFV